MLVNADFIPTYQANCTPSTRDVQFVLFHLPTKCDGTDIESRSSLPPVTFVSIERALDEYCEGKGPAPSPADISSAKRLRFLATEHLMSIRQVLSQARENATVI